MTDGETRFWAVLVGTTGLGVENGDVSDNGAASMAMTCGVVGPAAALLAGSTSRSSSMAGTGMDWAVLRLPIVIPVPYARLALGSIAFSF